MQFYRYRLPSIILLAVIVEIAVIVIFALVDTRDFATSDSSSVLTGIEAQWLTSSNVFAAQVFHEEGYIPLWQPWLVHGQPLVDESFSFVLNPISTIPSLIYDGPTGIKISAVLCAILAGLGGWALGRVMGFDSLARVLLGLLMVGKGNMHEMLGQGFFQLATTQAYLPWVAASTIATLRFKSRRWPVILLAVSCMLMFFAGNIYYMLPALVMVVLLTLSHMFYFAKTVVEGDEQTASRRLQIDWEAARRVILAGVLVLGLTAVTFLPIFANQSNIGGHPNEIDGGARVELNTAIQQFFTSERLFVDQALLGSYYSFVIPLWFIIIIFAILPIYPWLHQPANPREDWRIWLVGIFMVVFFTQWGAGQNPIVAWMYQNLPLIGQWRFVSRMLGVASFWIAVLVAMRVDGLWRVLNVKEPSPKVRGLGHLISQRTIGTGLMVLLIVGCFVASWQVNITWRESGATDVVNGFEDRCISWLRAENPNKELSVYTIAYYSMYTYLRNHVRHAHIGADYDLKAMTPTIYPAGLLNTDPEYFLPYIDDERDAATQRGYKPVEDSPTGDDGKSCLYQKEDVLSYAFSAPRTTFEVLNNKLPPSSTMPITTLERHADRIALAVAGDENQALVVAVQELAWPGWHVTVDGRLAKLESVGGFIGVVLKPGSIHHYIVFQYVPPLLIVGGIITLLTVLVCVIYLLRLERFLPPEYRKRLDVLIAPATCGKNGCSIQAH